MTKQIDTIMRKEMTRKEFLATLGLGVASIMGLSSVLHVLTGKSLGSLQNSAQGYGSRGYGK